MRTLLSLFFLAVLLTAAASLHARINETIAQCNERYGDPKKEITEGPYLKKYYFKNNMNILIVFYNNRAVLVTYAKPDLKDSFYLNSEGYKQSGWTDTITNQNPLINMNLPLTEKEIEYLKGSNAQTEKWNKTSNNSWLREKRNVKATYFPRERVLSFEMIKYDFDDKDGPTQKFNGL